MIVRPFSTSDVNSLIDSFDRWDAFPPCTDPSQLSESVDLVLYLSRNISSGDNRTLSARATVDAFLQNATDRPWRCGPAPTQTSRTAHPSHGSLVQTSPRRRSCFDSLYLLGANLTEEQDVYRPFHGGHDVMWNLGPNLQFYKMLQYFDEMACPEVLFMMESDTIPLARDWLHDLFDAKESRSAWRCAKPKAFW